jgi:leucyl aminopeptidase
MVDEDAYRPSDIIKTLSGHMVEIKDTDAEGRLVLADAMWYGQQTYKPKIVVDIATLTGVVGMALGNEYAGLFSNHQPLASDLLGAGKTTFEKLWQLPLHKNFDKQLQSMCADFTNLGNQPMPGASTAAQFLQRFVQKDVHWAHIDMAWLAFSKTDLPLSPAGATGFGVRLLHYFALQQNNLLD